MGKNASGQTHYLSLSGLELYGTVTAVCEDQLGMMSFLLYVQPLRFFLRVPLRFGR